jgi:uncharacterized protein YxjI
MKLSLDIKTKDAYRYLNTNGYTLMALYDMIKDVPFNGSKPEIAQVCGEDVILFDEYDDEYCDNERYSDEDRYAAADDKEDEDKDSPEDIEESIEGTDAGEQCQVYEEKDGETADAKEEGEEIRGRETLGRVYVDVKDKEIRVVLTFGGYGPEERLYSEVNAVIKGICERGFAENRNFGDVKVKLYIDSKFALTDKLVINSKDGRKMYSLKSNFSSTAFKVMDADDNPIYEIKKELIGQDYNVFKGNVNIGKLKKQFRLLRLELDGRIEDTQVHMAGDSDGMFFTITQDDLIIAFLNKAGHGDEIDIQRESGQDLAVAMALTMYEVLQKMKERKVR